MKWEEKKKNKKTFHVLLKKKAMNSLKEKSENLATAVSCFFIFKWNKYTYSEESFRYVSNSGAHTEHR